MKSKHKKLLGIVGIGSAVLLLSGCTANFCNDSDQAQMAYPYEQGVTVYCEKSAIPGGYIVNDSYSATISGVNAYQALPGNDQVYKYIPYSIQDNVVRYTAKKAAFINDTIISSAISSNYRLPTMTYFSAIDDYVLKAAVTTASGKSYTTSASFDTVDATFISSITVSTPSVGVWCVNPYTVGDSDGTEGAIIPLIDKDDSEEGKSMTVTEYGNNSILRKYGEIKFSGATDESGNNPLWGFYSGWLSELRYSTADGLGLDGCPNADFYSTYKSNVTSKVSANRSCIATRSDTFGHYGLNNNWAVEIQSKSWGYAWSKGFLEGLLVYPVSWLVDSIAYGLDPALSGFGQIWAIVLVTLIIRVIMMLATFKTTLGQQKMQALQPQLAKLQAKYPNSNTNQAEKQRLAQEQMALYKRNKIHPFSQIIVLLFQFPIFICVWSALQGSSALSSGEFLNMRLSDNINTILFNTSGTWYMNTSGWWTALVLFVLMAGAQFLSMFLPQMISKRKMKKTATKLTKNPAQDQQSKTMKWVSYGMLIFTIIMGFFLPSAMGVYWFIGALLSMAQTLVTQLVMAHQAKKRG